MKHRQSKILALILLGVGILAIFWLVGMTSLVYAQGPIVNPNDSRYTQGNYEINDLVGLFIIAARIILGISGSLALLMFVYGGFLFLVSAGNNERVERGKRAISAAVVGLVIIFSSYAIVGLVFKALGCGWNWASWDPNQQMDCLAN